MARGIPSGPPTRRSLLGPGERPVSGLVGEAIGAVHAGDLQHHSELVGSAPALGILLGGRHHLSLQPPGLAPLVEGDHVDPQLLGDLRYYLAVGRPHLRADISLDGLAVRTHRSIPLGPLVVEVPWWWKWSGWRVVNFPGRGGDEPKSESEAVSRVKVVTRIPCLRPWRR
jgi:hypothetical protein